MLTLIAVLVAVQTAWMIGRDVLTFVLNYRALAPQDDD